MIRLINIETLQLHSFITNPPPYAILSHRWTDNELTFLDFANIRHSGSSGARKVLQFCDFVKRANEVVLQGSSGKVVDPFRQGQKPPAEYIEWAWVDTCCIDKSSSAELSESINSMYAYYRLSAYCVAYLSDVDNLDQVQHSVYWSRGWTLQELLAPETLFVCDGSWNIIGSKEQQSFNELIGGICGIQSVYLLHPDHVSKASVAQRFSWAARRTTTVIEDMAYCLIGLFNVNMPLLYGEGKKAFRRLQEQIIQQSNDESIFAWTTGPNEQSTGSILASHPGLFASAGDVYRIDVIPREPYEITNKGLRFTAQEVVAIGRVSGFSIVQLNCAKGVYKSSTLNFKDGDQETARPCMIVLRQNRNGTYRRIHSDSLIAPVGDDVLEQKMWYPLQETFYIEVGGDTTMKSSVVHWQYIWTKAENNVVSKKLPWSRE